MWTLVEEYALVWILDPLPMFDCSAYLHFSTSQAIVALPFLELLLALVFGAGPSMCFWDMVPDLRNRVDYSWAIRDAWMADAIN